MHFAERERVILKSLQETGFMSFRDLESQLRASQATIRRDLERLEAAGQITRVHGGVWLAGSENGGTANPAEAGRLQGVPFHENVNKNRRQKKAIGRAAANLCSPNEGIMIDGGSTTLEMCPHFAGKGMQVLTNSLHIVGALLPQQGTRVLVPGGQVFEAQNIVLSAAGDDCMPAFHAPKLFMGAASIGPAGIMQADIILVASERRLIDRAEQLIVLADSSKFSGPSGHVVCALNEIDHLITDSGITRQQVKMMQAAGVKVTIADR